MAAHRQAMVRGVDDHRVVGMRGVFQRVENAAHLLVELGDQTVIFTELITDDLLGAWPWRQTLVSAVNGVR